MSSTYTPTPSTAVGEITITNPSDGDALTAASNNVGQSKLADYLARVYQQLRIAAATTLVAISSTALFTSLRRLVVSSDGLTLLALDAATSTTLNITKSTDFGGSFSSSAVAPSSVAPLSGYHDGTTWVVVGTGGFVWTSPDGTTWTARTSGTANDLTNVVKSGSLWVAVGASSTIITSPDAITWTARTPAFSFTGTSQYLAYTGSNFVLCSTGQANAIQTSPDGITWTTRTVGSLVSSSFASGMSPFMVPFAGGSVLVLVGQLAGGHAIFTSPDGVTWTQRTIAQTASGFLPGPVNATWAGGFGWNGNVFLLQASKSLFTSSDGLTFSQRAALLGTMTPVANMTGFIIAGGSGTTNGLVRSMAVPVT